MKLKIYCEPCGKFEEFFIEPVKRDKLNKKPWADIVTKKCKFVVATFQCDKECEIEIVEKKD